MPLRNLPSGNSPLKCVTLAHRVQVLSSTLFSFPLSFFHKRMYCILKIIISFIQPSCFRLLCFRKSFFFFFHYLAFAPCPFCKALNCVGIHLANCDTYIYMPMTELRAKSGFLNIGAIVDGLGHAVPQVRLQIQKETNLSKVLYHICQLCIYVKYYKGWELNL